MGGTAVISAAAQMKPPPTAVVSLSGPGSFDLMSALDRVPHLRMPKLFVVGADRRDHAAARLRVGATTGACRA